MIPLMAGSVLTLAAPCVAHAAASAYLASIASTVAPISWIVSSARPGDHQRGGRSLYNVWVLANDGGRVTEEHMETIHGLAELEAIVGKEIGPTDWFTVDQARVNGFADDTEDHQWIHVDPERASAGPFGGPVAQGFLTLSLIP